MPISLDIATTAKQSRALWEQLQRDSKFASRTGITRTAFNTRQEITKALSSRLDRPVSWIQKAYNYERATNLDKPQARVFVKDKRRAQYITSVVRTGANIPSAITKRARSRGLLKGRENLVPTRNLKRNSKGNIGKAKSRRLLQEGIRIKKGPLRGLYERRGKKLIKLLTPATVRRYRPPVNVIAIANQQARLFPQLYGELFERNRQKTLSKRNLAQAR